MDVDPCPDNTPLALRVCVLILVETEAQKVEKDGRKGGRKVENAFDHLGSWEDGLSRK